MDYNKIEKFWKSKTGNNVYASMISKDLSFAIFRHYSERERILSKVKFNKEDSILDLGCGSGRWERSLSPYVKEIVGVDFSEELLDIAEHNSPPTVKFIKSNVLDFDTDKKFDHILLSGVIQYLDNKDLNTLLQKCKGWLKEGGDLIIIVTVSLNSLFYTITDNFEGIYRTLAYYKTIFLYNDFEIVSVMDSHPLYLFSKQDEYVLLTKILESKIVNSLRYIIRKRRLNPSLPMIFICKRYKDEV